MNSTLFFVCRAATFLRSDGTVALADFSWEINRGETWAIVGPTGSGKTTLAQAVRSRLRHVEGSIAWPFLESIPSTGSAPKTPAEAIQHLGFKEESRLFSHQHHYYQQRYNFIEPEDDLTVNAFLQAGNLSTEASREPMLEQLGIADLLERSLIQLSNGQLRRTRIAKALLTQPDLLMLDEPFLGLDRQGKTEIANLLGQLRENGLQFVLITAQDRLPEWVTHRLELKEGKVISRGAFQQQVEGLYGIAPIPTAPETVVPSSSNEPILEVEHANVSYGDKPILFDISWTVRRGERWALLGPNGSGKTTLLSLLCGDHPQAYANTIRLFGRQRGSGETIWEIKRRIGLLSPELHLCFSEPLTAYQAAATGFHDVMARRSVTAEQSEFLRFQFGVFGLLPLADRPFRLLSTGQQRLVLFIRAIVKAPELLILDEPFQGLDPESIGRLRDWLETTLLPSQTLLMVTHDDRELPQNTTHRLRLEQGRMVEGS